MAFTIIKTKGKKGIIRFGKGKFIGFSSRKEAEAVRKFSDKRRFRNTRVVTVSKAKRLFKK